MLRRERQPGAPKTWFPQLLQHLQSVLSISVCLSVIYIPICLIVSPPHILFLCTKLDSHHLCDACPYSLGTATHSLLCWAYQLCSLLVVLPLVDPALRTIPSKPWLLNRFSLNKWMSKLTNAFYALTPGQVSHLILICLSQNISFLLFMSPKISVTTLIIWLGTVNSLIDFLL